VAGFFALTMDITALKRIEAQLEELARHDMLTGLANRRHFEEGLSEFLLHREQGPFALMFMDIDQFKPSMMLMAMQQGTLPLSISQTA
jgi:GGDEF domain-containing protein